MVYAKLFLKSYRFISFEKLHLNKNLVLLSAKFSYSLATKSSPYPSNLVLWQHKMKYEPISLFLSLHKLNRSGLLSYYTNWVTDSHNKKPKGGIYNLNSFVVCTYKPSKKINKNHKNGVTQQRSVNDKKINSFSYHWKRQCHFFAP